MTNIYPLSSMPYAKARVFEYDDGSIALVSYNTPVIVIDADGWLTCTGTYSQTTRKHISAFMKERIHYPNGSTGSYYTAKDAYINNYKYNIHTGEIKDI